MPIKAIVRDAVADILQREGVRHVFGQSGGHVCAIWEGVLKNGTIAPILNKQEGNGAYMADGYARISKRVGVVIGTAGPGLLNMASALANAYIDSVPMVVLGSTIRADLVGRNALQDGSGRGHTPAQAAALTHVTKGVLIAPSPATVPGAVREAFRAARSGRPGPVVVEAPFTFWDQEIDYTPLEPHQYHNTSPSPCHPADCAAVAARLFDARRPCILLGEAADGALGDPALMARLRRLGVPFLVAPMAKSYVDEHDPLCVGTLRQPAPSNAGYAYLKEADLVLLLGCRLQEFQIQLDASGLEGSVLAQVDPDPDEIGRVFPIDVSAAGSVTSFLESLGDRVHPASGESMRRAAQLRAELDRPGPYPETDGIHMLNYYAAVQAALPQDAVVVLGTGFTKSMALNAIRTSASQFCLVADSFGPMGYEVPATIGAAIATGKLVICLTGDGSFQMACNELGTLVNHPARVIYAIANNGGQQSIAAVNRRRYSRAQPDCDVFRSPDFAALAGAYGMRGVRVSTYDELTAQLNAAVRDDAPAIIEARIDPRSLG